MTLDEMVELVLTELDTDPDDPTYWSRADVIDALNEGYEEITDATEWYEVTLPLPLLARRTYFDLNTLGINVLTLLHIHNSTTQRWLTWLTHRQLDGHNREWMYINGEPEWSFRRGLNWLGLFPYSAADYGRLKLSATAMVRRMAHGFETPGFPEEFHRGLVDYALAELKFQDHEADTALEWYVSYLDYEAGLKNHVLTRTALDQHHQLGGM